MWELRDADGHLTRKRTGWLTNSQILHWIEKVENALVVDLQKRHLRRKNNSYRIWFGILRNRFLPAWGTQIIKLNYVMHLLLYKLLTI